MYKKIAIACTILLAVTTETASSQNQRIAKVDSTTMAYYQQCLKVLSDPIVLHMADTLYCMAQENEDKRMQAVALCTKLDHYYYNNEMEHQRDSIIKWTEQVQQFAKATDQPKYYYFVWGARLINHYLYKKEYNTALLEAEKMLKEAQEEDYKEGIADCYSVLANIYTAKGLNQQSIEFSYKEVEFFEKHGLDRYNISIKYGIIAEDLLRKGEFEEAEKYFAKGEKHANTPFHEVYIQLGRVRTLIGNGDLQAAKKILAEVQQAYATTPYLEGRQEILHRTEVIYYTATKEFDKAVAALNNWEEVIRKRQLDALKPAFYQIKGDLYRDIGQTKEASESYREYINITQEERLQNEKIATAEIATLLNIQKLNTEKKELEELTKERQLHYTVIVIILLSAILVIVISFLIRQRRLNRRLKRSRDALNKKNIVLLKAEEELRQAKDAAEGNCKMKDVFIQNISHEIRTPLNSIVGFTTILSEACPKEEVSSYVETIEKNSQLLLQMINDIIEISDLDRGVKKVRYKPVSINQCGDLAIEEARPLLSEGVELSFTSLAGDPLVNTDEQLVMQVLRHLLGNAAKFTTSGGINLITKVDKKKNEVRFIVTDTGIGIPLQEQEHIFERFVKLNEFSQGAGLGLSISRLSAERLGGYLILDNDYTQGTRFVFGIPLGK